VIRRLPAALTAIVLTGMLASGCSTFTKNGDAASVNGRHLPVGDFEALAKDFGDAPDANGELAGDSVRQVLTQWVSTNLLGDLLASRGAKIDDAARATAEASLATDSNWAGYNASTKKILIDQRAQQIALYEPIYNAGPSVSKIVCLRVIALADAASAQAVSAELKAGGDFATIAKAKSIDTTTGQQGGIYSVASTSGGAASECVATSSLVATALDPLSKTPIGTPTDPIQLGTNYFIFLQRPYLEVTKFADPLLPSPVSAEESAKALSSAHVSIDSRYGMWDPATGKVVPTR
jgi:hypothetical protein